MIPEASARAIQSSTVAVERFRRVEQSHRPSITADRRRLSIGDRRDGARALPGGHVLPIGALAGSAAIAKRAGGVILLPFHLTHLALPPPVPDRHSPFPLDPPIAA